MRANANWECFEGACQLHLLNDISYQRNCRETDLEQIALTPPYLAYGKPYTHTPPHTHGNTFSQGTEEMRRTKRFIPFHFTYTQPANKLHVSLSFGRFGVCLCVCAGVYACVFAFISIFCHLTNVHPFFPKRASVAGVCA